MTTIIASLPRILFFPINGAGMGHMNRCLAYACRLRHMAQCSFFTLASAIECIETMGFDADYFVSPFLSDNSPYAWNRELAIRFGMMLERISPQVVVFDGTWPFQGFLAACRSYRHPLKLVWSNRGLFKRDRKEPPVDTALFDLILEPGELGTMYKETTLLSGVRKVTLPPVILLEESELLDRTEARRCLSLKPQERYALFSLGAGNVNDIGSAGHALVHSFQEQGYHIVWACAPISVRDVALPPKVTPVSIYPLARYFRAFDVFAGAAGYNTCCEVAQTRIPSLLVPNTVPADDQARRARIIAEHAPVVVSSCETQEKTNAAVGRLLQIMETYNPSSCPLDMNGAAVAAEAILGLMGR